MVRAAADGDADVRAGERGGVVDAVADHNDLPPLGLQFADDAFLVLRQHVGDDAVEVELPADGVGRRLVVAGEHNDLAAVGLHTPDRRRRWSL